METEAIRRQLVAHYGMDFSPKKLVRSSNPVMGFLQRHFAAFKVRIASDVVNLEKLPDYLR